MSSGGIPERPGALLEAPGRMWQRDPLLGTGAEHRLVPGGEALFAFAWVLEYRDGRRIAQYERIGEALFQTLFGKIDPKGVARIQIYDVRGEAPRWIADVVLPAQGDVEADILCNCGFSFGDMRIERIYTFGFRGPGVSSYLHVSPSDPIKAWVSPSRLM